LQEPLQAVPQPCDPVLAPRKNVAYTEPACAPPVVRLIVRVRNNNHRFARAQGFGKRAYPTLVHHSLAPGKQEIVGCPRHSYDLVVTHCRVASRSSDQDSTFAHIPHGCSTDLIKLSGIVDRGGPEGEDYRRVPLFKEINEFSGEMTMRVTQERKPGHPRGGWPVCLWFAQ
jgi:hypothetical protein